jgi:hypothetical protein
MDWIKKDVVASSGATHRTLAVTYFSWNFRGFLSLLPNVQHLFVSFGGTLTAQRAENADFSF